MTDDEMKTEEVLLDVLKQIPGRRIDKFLAMRFQFVSRSFLQKQIDDGHITVNGNPVKCSYEVKRGDRIRLALPVIEERPIEPENIPLDIVYEDDHIILVNKPVDLVIHPARGHIRGTFVNALAYHCRDLSSVGGPLKPGIIHRLDRDTTGIIVAAKTNDAHRWLAYQFEHRKVRKEYWVVVEGEMEYDSDVIEKPIGRHPSVREKMAIRRDGREAVTAYEVIERFRGFTLVRALPKTGRTHQIRVHLRSVNHPVVADEAYGRSGECYLSELQDKEREDGERPLIERQALHARKLGFNHPIYRKWMEFEAALPKDMSDLIAALRAHRKIED